MWLMNKNGFFSLVQHNQDEDVLMIRARVRADLEEAFPDDIDQIVETIDGDYRYRISLPREQVKQYVASTLDDLTYTSHAKEEMSAGKEPGRIRAYMSVWSTLGDLQPGGPYNSRGRFTASQPRLFDQPDTEDIGEYSVSFDFITFKRSSTVEAGGYDLERGLEFVKINDELIDILAVEDNLICKECDGPVLLAPDSESFVHAFPEDDTDHSPIAILDSRVEVDRSFVHTFDRPLLYEEDDVRAGRTTGRRSNVLGETLAGALETVKENVKDD